MPKHKLKISFMHVALDCRGGAERKMLLLAQHVNSLPNVELEILVHNFEPKKTFQEYLTGLKVTVVPTRGLVRKIFALWKMARLAKHADLIHAHNHPAHFAAVFSKWMLKKPILWYDNEPLLYLEGTRRKTRWLKLVFLRLFEKFLLPSIDVIVANSRNTQNNIKRFLKRDSIIIYSGVDTTTLKPKENRVENKRPRAFTIGRFEKEKNIEFVLKLAQALPDFDFVIAGNGPLEQHFRMLIQERKLQNVELSANIPESQKIEFYQTSDVFVFPTLNEPLGINIVEAMSCGLVPVAFNSGGARETIVNNETGFLVETEDEFIEKMKFLAEHQGVRQQMGEKGRQRVLDNFSLQQMVNKTLRLYQELLKKYGKEELAGLLKEMQ